MSLTEFELFQKRMRKKARRNRVIESRGANPRRSLSYIKPYEIPPIFMGTPWYVRLWRWLNRRII